jgi:hypothetical protein
MFRRIALIVLVIGLTLSLAVIPAAAKTETLHFKFQGKFADAFFGTFDETGCIETFVHVSAQDGKVKRDGKPEVESFATVHIEQVNRCATEFLVLAFGRATLAPDEFVIDNKLNQATLTTTIVVDEFISGTTVPVEVNVTWTGVGETSTFKNHFQMKEPGFQFKRHAMGAFREAQASGTVTAMGINFTTEPAFEAAMGDVKIGEVTISHDL